ncbi:MAG: hypothetical protein GWP05_05225 [Anaerolineaceae bacterium]|nr:hypothetical protein [Anaerolineaceae bacterium]
MSSNEQKPPRRNVAVFFYPLVFCLLLCLIFVYVWLRIDPSLVYHQTRLLPSLISVTDKAPADFLTYPGGPIDYVANALSERYFDSLLGARIIALLMAAVSLATLAAITPLGLRRSYIVAFGPALLLVFLFGQYNDMTTLALRLVGVCLAAGVYMRIPTRRLLVRTAIFLVMTPLVYMMVGEAYFLFALICGLFEVLNRRWLPAAVGFVLAVLVPCFGSMYLLDETINWLGMDPPWPAQLLPMFYHPWTHFELFIEGEYVTTTATALGLAAFFVLVAASGLSCQLAGRSQPAARKQAAGAVLPPRPVEGWTSYALQVVCLLAVGLLVFSLFSEVRKTRLQIDYYAENKMWPELLAAARQDTGGYDACINYYVNQALYHTGQLSQAMFSYPQTIEGVSLIFYLQDKGDPCPLGRPYFEMGRVNEAERIACETIESGGERPMPIRLLADINIVKKRPEAARIYLRKLRKYRKYRAQADGLLARLDEDPLLSSDPEVRRIRSVIFKRDFTIGGRKPLVADRWKVLLRANRLNRQAFEYLMAHYLLSRQVMDFVANLHRLDDFDYDGIPRHYEEAILVYHVMSKKRLDLGGRKIRPETFRRFAGFARSVREIKAATGDRRAQLFSTLARQYGDTFYYYFYFGPGGVAL